MTLKIGDIKGIEQGGRRIPCVVVRDRGRFLDVITIQGEKIVITSDNPYGIVRLDTAVRAAFERIGKEAKEIDKRLKQKEKINEEIRVIEAKMNRECRNIQKESGLLSSVQFLEVLHNNMPKGLQRDMEEYMRNSYVQEDGEKVRIILARNEDIQKYAQPHQYDFLYAEYDGVIMIGGVTNQYKDLVKRYSRGDRELQGQKGIKVTHKRGLSLGDKNWLGYVHEQAIEIKTKEGLTKDLAIQLSKTIKRK